jgi:hypothetical protein
MNSRDRSTVRADYIGIAVSAACAVHCLLVPLIVAFSPVLAHFIPASEKVHRTLAFAVIGAGLLAFRSGYRRHRQRRVLVFMGIGIAAIVAASLLGEHLPHAAETLITLFGSAFVIRAHWMNHSFCRDCRNCVPQDSH